MIVPSIWENKSHVPNHQSVLVAGDPKMLMFQCQAEKRRSAGSAGASSPWREESSKVEQPIKQNRTVQSPLESLIVSSGKLSHNFGKSQFLLAKLTISHYKWPFSIAI